ncbi:hypothetical protein SH661x_001663 [Planctomicrobium sp. SH661]|uniref:hypothetical protein n=1 Tax=Planctomicrobium sp. SH661 TaxID=3448124 RepID=UPI003F5AF8AC
MKVRNLVGGAVIGALALGIWLGSFWKGPGLGGSGTGFGTSSQTGSSDEAALDRVHVSGDLVGAAAGTAKTQPQEPEVVPTDMMTIVIYGNEYRLVDGEAPQSGKVLTLNEIADRAKQLTGTPEGIRVRILKGKSAQEGARADLLKYLAENGVKREEIQERAEFVD